MALPARQERLRGRHALVDGIRYVMPVDATEASAMIAAFPCDLAAATALMPQADVHPFRWMGRALLVVTVIDYRATDIGPYIEYSLAIACTKGAHPAPVLLPALFQRAYGTGQFVFDLPVSSEVSVKGGKGIWGMPKHQASLDFRAGRRWASAQYDQGGATVCRFDVRVDGRLSVPLATSAANYCVFRGMMMRSFIHFRGRARAHLMAPGSARLVLGDHPRAEVLRRLEHRPVPLFVAWLPTIAGLLDDYFDCWFVTPRERPEGPIGEGLETTYPLGQSQDWLAPPARDPAFDLDRE